MGVAATLLCSRVFDVRVLDLLNVLGAVVAIFALMRWYLPLSPAPAGALARPADDELSPVPLDASPISVSTFAAQTAPAALLAPPPVAGGEPPTPTFLSGRMVNDAMAGASFDQDCGPGVGARLAGDPIGVACPSGAAAGTTWRRPGCSGRRRCT